MIYLASPYTDRDLGKMEERYQAVSAKVAELMRRGEVVFSPIAYCHPLAKAYDLPRNFEFWKEFDEEMIGLATELTILMLPSWENSDGIKRELEIAKRLKKGISYAGV